MSAGVDVDLTPRLKAIFTANAIALDATETLEALLFQSNIHRRLGEDFSAGLRYRPRLTNNVIIAGGLAAFLPGRERVGKIGRFSATLIATGGMIILLLLAGSLVNPKV